MTKKIKNENDSTTFNLQANIHNRFDIEILDVNTKEVKQKAQAFNIICNNLWTTLFNQQSYFQYIHYGRGSGTPSSADTSLFSLISAQQATNFYYSVNWKNGIYSMTGSIQLQAATSVGETITEVGIGNTATTLCTHAMIQDMNGNPISITKTDTDIINIYATVYVHFNPNGYDKGSIHFHKFDNYTCLLDCFAGRWGNFPNSVYVSNIVTPSYRSDYGYYPGYLSPTSTSLSRPDKTYLTTQRNLANKTFTFTLNRLEAATYNYSGLKAIYITYEAGNNYITTFPVLILEPGGDWFPESVITNEIIGTGDGVTKDFPLSFQFARDANIYVNGNLTAATVDYLPMKVTDNCYMGYFKFLNPSSTHTNHIIDMHKTAANGISRYFYNPAAEKMGIGKMYIPPYFSISASNDFENWDEVISYSTSGRSNVTVPTKYQHYKYWKIKNNGYSNETFISSVYPAIAHPGNVVHFTEAPPEGAIITADYKCDCIAKDENNVFDMTVQIQLGEYTEET